MRRFTVGLTLVVSMLCWSCANKNAASPSDQPHATVQMRDGTSVSGAVTATSPTEITLAGDDNVPHTIPMKQVKSIAYDEPSQTPAAQVAPEAGHQDHYHPPQSDIRTKTYDLPVGTEVSVRTEETIDSGKAAEGQTYAAEVTRDVVDAAGDVVIPRGSNAQVVIRSASKGGRIRGSADLVLDLKSVSVEGQEYALHTADLAQRGKDGVGANRRTAEYTGGGAAIGAIIGAIAGGGKGAAIGAGSGAGAGALTQILTKGGAIRVPAETVLTFKLDRALHVTTAP
jgi:hypothetical protein